MTSNTDPPPAYPHQTGSGEVTPEHLAEHYTAHPDQYHEALKPHIETFLGGQAVATAQIPEELPAQESAPLPPEPTVEELIANLKKGTVTVNTPLSLREAVRLIEAGEGESVAAYLDRFTGLDASIAYKLIEAGEGESVAAYLDRFTGLDASIAYKLIEAGEGWSVATYLDKFTSLDHADIANKLIEAGESRTVAAYLRKFTGLDASIAYKLIEAGEGWSVAAYLASFTSLDHADIANKLIEAGEGWSVVDYLDRFTGLDASVAHKLIEAGKSEYVAAYLDKFTSLDHAVIANKMIEAGEGRSVAINLASFTSLDHADIARRLIREGQGDMVAHYINNFNNLDQSVATDLLDAKDGYLVFAHLDHFVGLDISEWFLKLLNDYPNWIDAFDVSKLEGVDLSGPVAAKLRDVLPVYLQKEYADTFTYYASAVGCLPDNEKPETMRQCAAIFSAYATRDLTKVVYELLNNEAIPDEAREVGVTKTGEPGIEQLKDASQAFIEKLKQMDITDEIESQLLGSGILRSLFMRFVEYDNSGGFGSHDEQSLVRKLKYRIRAEADGRIEPMPSEYTTSKTYELGKLSGKKEASSWTPDLLERYNALLTDIRQANAALDEPQAFTRLTAELRVGIKNVIDKLQLQIDAVDPGDVKADVKRQNLERRRQNLERYLAEVNNGQTEAKRFVMNSPADFQRGFLELEPYPELHSAMRQLTFAWALRKNPGQRAVARGLSSEPSIDDIANVREFIEHVTNQETYGEYFTDKKAAGKFKKLSSTKALEEAMTRFQQSARRGGTTRLQFMPSRGILLEISGQIGDACWADKNKSIAEDMPNLTAVIMRARPGEKNERIVGSALLIETRNPDTDEGVLVLRGTNPTENYINKVDIADYYEAITDYVRELAAKRGLIPAIVIDDHSGGSGTNRPALFGYLRARLQNLEKIKVENSTTFFNGYNVTNDTYRLDTGRQT